MRRIMPSPDRIVIQASIEDAGHFTPEQRAQIIASYPEHERAARTRGIPQLGSGRVFPISIDDILCDSFVIPDHWAQLGGLDFGWQHPTAAVKMAFNRDTDELYITATHRKSEQTPVMFAGSVKGWGDWLPWAWPHDGLQHDKGSGEQLASQYRAQGLKMHMVHATFESGGNGFEAGVSEMLERFQTNRLMVFRELKDWCQEFELYHRKDGIVVKENDDILSATRIAMMMRRIAKTKIEADPKKRPQPPREPVFGRSGDEHGWLA
jgi:hypothetical protein